MWMSLWSRLELVKSLIWQNKKCLLNSYQVVDKIKLQLKKLSATPGVYIFRDKTGEII